MRRVGQFNDSNLADRFQQYLQSKSIESVVREDQVGNSVIWVYDEDRIEESKDYFNSFAENPNHKDFRSAVASRLIKPRLKAEQDKPSRPRPNLNRTFKSSDGIAMVTISCILISVFATILLQNKEYHWFVSKLYYSRIAYPLEFQEIASGQLWRLFTPIFLHGGWLHLAFNMLWLYQLGTQIERIASGKKLLTMMAIMAITCNTSQYLVSGPNFVGMSGVVYGLLGYLWIMTKYDAAKGYYLDQQTVVFMLIWMAICIIGIIPNVANTQHVVGLIVGVVWAFIESGYLKAYIRRKRFQTKSKL